MNDQNGVIADVLGEFVDLTPEHPAAQALRETVAALKTAEPVDTTVDAITVECMPGVVVRPDDVLILAAPRNITIEQLDRIKAEVFKRLPGIADVVVLGGVYVTGVYREGNEAT